LTRLLALLLLAPLSFAQSKPSADLIVTNARIWTGEKAQPAAAAVAVIGDRIVAAGSVEEIDAWRGADTQVLDARGKLLLPGFNDAHVHFSSGGFDLEQVALNDADSPEEFARRIAEHAKSLKKGEWVLGGNWDDQKFTPPRMPTRWDIDKFTPNTPVFVSRYDGHMALANTVALELAGITAKTKAPAGGEIVRLPDGTPTGALKDAAMELVYKVIPKPSRERRLRAIRKALAHAVRLGVTSVQDMSLDYADIDIYAELAAAGGLTTRIYAAPPIADWNDQAKLGVHRAFGSPYLRIGAVKGFADGSLGSTTAYFFQPYSDQPNTRGLLMHKTSELRGWIAGADRAGLQNCIHAIGDQAISIVLDIYADVAKQNPARDRRFRIEHVQHLARKDIPRFAELNVIASMQPFHAIDDGRWAEGRIGPERVQTTYAFRSLLDAGVRLAVGTDWQVAPLNPMLTIYAATTRQTLDGKNPAGWVPEQKISVEETVAGYTLGSAYAEFQEHEKGSIARGKLADMVILSDDIFSIPPEKIREVTVETTIVGGKVVYQKQ
jgi:predicted amidohydrolase YtcJ